MMKHNTHRLALMGLLTALGLIIGYIEFLIPIPLGIPGVKPGFANIVIVWALYSLEPWEALMINGMRIFLSGFLFGNFSMILYSLAGAAVSFLCMCLAKKSGLFSMTGVSMIGGVMHNMGQLLVAMAVLGNSKSGILWSGASGCGGDHRASDRHRDRRSEEKDSGCIGEKDRIIVRKRILCILFP